MLNLEERMKYHDIYFQLKHGASVQLLWQVTIFQNLQWSWAWIKQWNSITSDQILLRSNQQISVSYISISVLILSQMTNFRLFQTKRICRRQFWIWWKWQKVLHMGGKHWEKKKLLVTSIFSFSHSVFLSFYCRHRVRSGSKKVVVISFAKWKLLGPTWGQLGPNFEE